MRKSIILVLLVAILLQLAGCAANTSLESLKQIHEQEQPLYNAYPVEVYLKDNVYYVVILNNSKVIKGADFSAERVPNNVVDMELIHCEDIHVYLGKTLSDVEAALGNYHIDIGSGGFMPSYITEDGYLITFSVDHKTKVVEHVGKMDLFSGESVEWYFLS